MWDLVPGEKIKIINVNQHKHVNHISEDFIHELIHGRSIYQSKRHYKIFIVPSSGDKRGLPFITLPYTKQIVCSSEIQFRENRSSAEFLKWRRDKRKRIAELHSGFVQGPIIYAGLKTNIFLLNKNETWRCWGMIPDVKASSIFWSMACVSVVCLNLENFLPVVHPVCSRLSCLQLRNRIMLWQTQTENW